MAGARLRGQGVRMVRSSPWWRALLLGLLCVALGAANAAEPVCQVELRAALPRLGVPDGVVAVELMAAAVRRAEPALSPWRDRAGPIPAGEPGAAAARFLDGVGLLPRGWTPENHDVAAWQTMHDRFAGWYRATPASVTGGDRSQMVNEAAATLGAVSQALRPLSVFATGPDDEITFFAVVWNWSPVPRLLLFAPPAGLALTDGRGDARPAQVLASMSSCALRFQHYVYAREDLAIQMFGQQGESVFRVLGSEPTDAVLPAFFEAERVLDVFRFRDPRLAGVRVLAGGVEGPSVGVGTVLRLLANLRSNMGLDGVFYYTAFP